MEVRRLIEHTLLDPNARKEDVERVCREAKENGFFAVCIPPFYVSYAKKILSGSDIKVVTVVGFPLGYSKIETKAFEARQAVEDGADEIDMVMNRCALKNGDYEYVKREIENVVKSAEGRVVKVIIETCDLNEEEIKIACRIAEDAGAHFVKTSTGFRSGGALVEDIALMKSVLKKAKIKASGGIRSYEQAIRMFKAGASRIGASRSLDIIRGEGDDG